MEEKNSHIKPYGDVADKYPDSSTFIPEQTNNLLKGKQVQFLPYVDGFAVESGNTRVSFHQKGKILTCYVYGKKGRKAKFKCHGYKLRIRKGGK